MIGAGSDNRTTRAAQIRAQAREISTSVVMPGLTNAPAISPGGSVVVSAGIAREQLTDKDDGGNWKHLHDRSSYATTSQVL
jgi:hypothetical protein